MEAAWAPAAAVAGAMLLDAARGDPRNRYHPTAWVGRMVAALIPLHGGRVSWGAAVCVMACLAAGAPVALFHWAVWFHLDGVAAPAVYLAVAVPLLKSTIGMRGMRTHAAAVVSRLEGGDGPGAAGALARIVKRPTAGMGRAAVCSATIESVAENTPDGVTGPLFYVGWFGLAGAFVYRTVNTIDAMAGYRTPMLDRVGRFGALADTALGWAPARITAYVMVLAAAVTGHDGAGALRALKRDARKPSSRNSGYAMAAMAGALHVRLHKPGHYTMGGGDEPDVRHVHAALRISECTAWMFAGIVGVPATLAVWTVWGAVA